MSDDEEIAPVTADDFKITPNFCAEEYEKDWSDRLTCFEENNDFAERNKLFEKFYKYIWLLLFGPEATPDSRVRAVKLLEVERPDAAFFNPFAYNDWIRTVKDEIIKRQLFDLWRDEFVKKELGLIWAKDSDYFDDLEDPEPPQFYKLPNEV